MIIGITAMGTASPPYQRQQQDTADLITASVDLKPAERRLLKSIYKASGIEKRHSVLSDYCKNPGQFEFFPNDPHSLFPTTAARMKIYKDNALSLALKAVENCVSSLSQFNLKDITHVITVSCTGMYAPGLDIELVKELQLHSNTQRTAINFMGCYGAFNAIKVAKSICLSHPHATVLIVSVELCTIHLQKNFSVDNVISNSLFADGSAAVIIQGQPKQDKYFSLEHFHCDLLPNTHHEMAWQIADYGFDIVLSSYVPAVIKSGIAQFISKLLLQNQLDLTSIDFYAIHPGGLKILQACEEALGITKECNRYSYSVLQNYGNMSSATILFVLKAIWDDLLEYDHNKTIYSCAFGPGLTLESMLLKTHCVDNP